MVAGQYASSTPMHTVRFCGEQLESIGFDELDPVTPAPGDEGNYIVSPFIAQDGIGVPQNMGPAGDQGRHRPGLQHGRVPWLGLRHRRLGAAALHRGRDPQPGQRRHDPRGHELRLPQRRLLRRRGLLRRGLHPHRRHHPRRSSRAPWPSSATASTGRTPASTTPWPSASSSASSTTGSPPWAACSTPASCASSSTIPASWTTPATRNRWSSTSTSTTCSATRS